ncbi:MAG: STAS domain-containing protein [Mycobacterium sp.]
MNSHHDQGATPGDFVVGEHWVGRTVVITASGDLDMLTAPALATAIAAVARTKFCALIIDLSTVDFLATAGMNVLVDTRRNILSPKRFGVVADGPATSRPLRLIGIDSIVDVYRNLDDAVNALA